MPFQGKSNQVHSDEIQGTTFLKGLGLISPVKEAFYWLRISRWVEAKFYSLPLLLFSMMNFSEGFSYLVLNSAFLAFICKRQGEWFSHRHNYWVSGKSRFVLSETQHLRLSDCREQEAAFHALKKQFEAKERENLELQRRVSQFSASTSMPSTYMPDFQRQLDTFNQQMAFKEQEVVLLEDPHSCSCIC